MERWPGPQETPGDDGPQLHRTCLFLIATILSPACVTGCPGERTVSEIWGCHRRHKLKRASFFIQEWASVPGSGTPLCCDTSVKPLCCALWHVRVHLHHSRAEHIVPITQNDWQAGTSATQEIQADASETRGKPTQISGNLVGLSFLKKWPFSRNLLIIVVNTQIPFGKAVKSYRGGCVFAHIY